MKCWACDKDMVKKPDRYLCECGATATLDEWRNPARASTSKQSKPKSSNGTLSLVLGSELKERLQTAAKKREITIEEYVFTILRREAGRSHEKKESK